MRWERLVLRNRKGISLIEILISVLLLSLVGIALLQTSLVSTSANLRNAIRDEAVNVAQDRMNQLRNSLFTDETVEGSLTATGGTVPDMATGTTSTIRTIRNFTVAYTRSLNITNIGTGAKQITISVGWNYKGQPFTHSITSIMKRSK